ncbi:MAG: low specificity L-threonine aldolase [Firmicutes bacterium]|nr:low specificity L-threonine aldolase [Bacillota bacterium]
MIRFESDYTEGAHSEILKALEKTNFEQTSGYGTDEYCEKAADIIRKLCGAENAGVHFLVGGTQTNTTVIAAALKPYQGVVSAETGHINVHETGAIEASGHKVITLESDDGKITAEQIKKLHDEHWSDESAEHTVQPAMVYISNPTENGTIYYKNELRKISKVCRETGMLLFMDGARMGYGLAAKSNDMTLKDIAELCDVFYIGGTKVGALFGEAVVITNKNLDKEFRYSIKQRGGMLAKGRLLGIQFVTLFENGLYFDISEHANRLAIMLKDAFVSRGWKLLYDSDTNQQFPIIPNEKLKIIGEKYSFSTIKKFDETTAVRFCTSWATKEENVLALIDCVKNV